VIELSCHHQCGATATIRSVDLGASLEQQIDDAFRGSDSDAVPFLDVGTTEVTVPPELELITIMSWSKTISSPKLSMKVRSFSCST